LRRYKVSGAVNLRTEVALNIPERSTQAAPGIGGYIGILS
jgi:hypothetical protein